MRRRRTLCVVVLLFLGAATVASLWRHLSVTRYAKAASYHVILAAGTLYLERASIEPVEFYQPPCAFEASADAPPDKIYRGFFPYLRYRLRPAIWTDDRSSYASVTHYGLVAIPL